MKRGVITFLRPEDCPLIKSLREMDSGRFCVVNNTGAAQSTTVFRGDGSAFPLELAGGEIRWYEI